MLKRALRLLFLRVLPGRLLTILTVVQVIRALRRRQRAPQRIEPRRLVTADGQDRAAA